MFCMFSDGAGLNLRSERGMRGQAGTHLATAQVAAKDAL
jgi:hypothetical protein